MPIRVLVVDDSLTVRKHLVELLSGDPEFEVVGEGADGRAAIELCQALKPDVLSMDMMMPVMTGLGATEYIMAYCPTPILICSASTNRGEALRTLDALAAGAVEVVDKPPPEVEPDHAWELKYKSMLRLVSRIKVIGHRRMKIGLAQVAAAERPPVEGALSRAATRPPGSRAVAAAESPPAEGALSRAATELIAIGASTGGPQALMQILPALPADFDLPILLVVHIDPLFDASFRDWLGGLSSLPCEHATDGMPVPERGQRRLVLAPSDRHLVIERGKLRLTRDKERHSCRPSVDVLFESLARELGPRAVACLLTGMGLDGAAGMVAMHTAGALTLAQDEASSIIFGMPREAIMRGGVSRVLPLDQFAPMLADLARSSRAEGALSRAATMRSTP